MDDYMFSTNDWGSSNKYGYGGECNCIGLGQIRMDLSGTDFHFHPSVRLSMDKPIL